MSDMQLIGWVRDLATHLREGGEFNEEFIAELEQKQDELARTYEKYEHSGLLEAAGALKDLMMEALQLVHDGLEDLLVYSEEPRDELLEQAVKSVEEGNDILDSLRYALEQDTSWTTDAAVG